MGYRTQATILAVTLAVGISLVTLPWRAQHGDTSESRIENGERDSARPASDVATSTTSTGRSPLTPEVTTGLELTVLSRSDDRPIAGLPVLIVPLGEGAIAESTSRHVTDADGRVLAPGARGRTEVHIGALDTSVVDIETGTLLRVTRRVDRGIDVVVRCIDVQGNPVPFCDVFRLTRREGLHAQQIGSTGSSGSLELRGVSPRDALVAKASGFAASRPVEVRDVVRHCSSQPGLVVPLVLRSGSGVVTGRVHDPAGRPLSGATVTLEQHVSVASTDANGAFRFDGVAAGQTFLRAYLRGRVPAKRTILVPPAVVTDISLVLDTGVTISGIVMDEQGRPIEGADVEVVTDASIDGTDECAEMRVTSGRGGRYRLVGVPMGTIRRPFDALVKGRLAHEVGTRLTSSEPATGSDDAWVTWIPTRTDYEWNPVLRPTGRLTLRVVDPSGRGIEGLAVHCYGGYRAAGSFGVAMQDLRGATDSSGSVTWRNCVADRYHVRIDDSTIGRWLLPDDRLVTIGSESHEIVVPGGVVGEVRFRIDDLPDTADVGVTVTHTSTATRVVRRTSPVNGVVEVRRLPAGRSLMRIRNDEHSMSLEIDVVGGATTDLGTLRFVEVQNVFIDTGGSGYRPIEVQVADSDGRAVPVVADWVERGVWLRGLPSGDYRVTLGGETSPVVRATVDVTVHRGTDSRVHCPLVEAKQFALTMTVTADVESAVWGTPWQVRILDSRGQCVFERTIAADGLLVRPVLVRLGAESYSVRVHPASRPDLVRAGLVSIAQDWNESALSVTLAAR